MFSCGVTFSRRTEKGVSTVVLALCFSGYFMSILSSSWYRNIHVSVYTHTRIHTYIQNLFIYLYIYIHTHVFVYDRVCLAWPCQRLQPAGLASACHEANEAPKRPSGGPCRCGAPARRKAGPRPGPVGTARPRAAPRRPAPPPGRPEALGGPQGGCGGPGPPRHLGHLRSSWHFLCILVIS